MTTAGFNTARAGGFFWLLTILTGATAMAALGGIVVAGDAAATATNVIAHQSALRSGVVLNLIATLCYIGATVFVYDLLAPVHKNVSLLAALFSMTGSVAGAVGGLFGLAPVTILGGAPYLHAFNAAQLQSLAYLSFRLGGELSNIAFLFFGLHCFLIGCLLLQSKFMSRTVGVLMIFAGLGWLTFSLSSLLSPPLAHALTPFIMLPGIIGETSLTLWLLVKGVTIPRAVLIAEEVCP